MTKICPLKFNSTTLDKDGTALQNACLCDGEDCALWEEFTGTCALKTDAYLKGREVSIREASC